LPHGTCSTDWSPCATTSRYPGSPSATSADGCWAFKRPLAVAVFSHLGRTSYSVPYATGVELSPHPILQPPYRHRPVVPILQDLQLQGSTPCTRVARRETPQARGPR